MTPVERAAAAIERCVGIFDTTFQDDARAAFRSIDVDELAGVLARIRLQEDMPYVIARAVIAHLTKGDESND